MTKEISRKCSSILSESERLENVQIEANHGLFFGPVYARGKVRATNYGLGRRGEDDDIASDTELVSLHPDDEQFEETLGRVQACIRYLENHSQYYDSSMYLRRQIART